MKKLILSIALSVGILAVPAAAQKPSVDAFCTKLSEVSFSAIKMRQSGVPVYRTRQILHNVLHDPNLIRLVDAIVAEAYTLPKLHTDSSIGRQAAEFANVVYYQCVSRLGAVSFLIRK